MTPSLEWSVQSTAATLDGLGIGYDRDRLFNAVRRLEHDEFRVAVVGLVSRGKSTFINQLIGADVCAAGAKAETAAVVSIKAGPAGARGRTSSGESVELPTVPSLFREALQRSSGDLVEAEFSGEVSLPVGITLVDTPGVDEAALAQPERLVAQWSDSGANASILVIGVPPGAARADLELLRRLNEIMPSGVLVVAKQTDSTLDDLSTVVHHLLETQDIDAIGVGPTERSDDVALERVRAWVRRAARSDSERSSSGAMDDIALSLVTAERSIRRLGRDHVEQLRRAVERSDDIEPTIAAALSETLASVEHSAAAGDRRGPTSADRSAMLDESARRLAERLGDGDVKARWDMDAPIYKELFALASQGSVEASRHLAGIMGVSPERREPQGLGPGAIFSGLGDATVIELVGRRRLGPVDLGSLIEANRDRPGLDGVVRDAIATVPFSGWALADIRAIVERASGTPCYGQLTDAVSASLRSRLTSASTAWSTPDVKTFERLREEEQFARLAIEQQWGSPQLRDALNAAIAQLADHGSEMLAVHTGWLLREPVADLAAWRRERLLPTRSVAGWVASLRPPRDDVRAASAALAEGGAIEKWAIRSCELVHDATVRAAKKQDGYRTAHTLSFVGWGVSVLMLAASPVLAFYLWLGSLITWVVSRQRREVAVPWQTFYVSPTVDIPEGVGSASTEDVKRFVNRSLQFAYQQHAALARSG